MINERDIALRFTAIWGQIFPLLTPNFISKFNQSSLESVWQNREVASRGHADVIAEMAFNIARMAHSKKSTIAEVKENRRLITKAFHDSVKTIQSSSPLINLPDQLSTDEVDESLLLAENIVLFTQIWNNVKISYAPNLPGYGPINSCEADLSIGDTLFEIKTVKRKFRSKDLKQLLVYIALARAARNETWKYCGLYNPRTGQYCRLEVESLVRNLSAYTNSKEAFRDFLELFVRDAQIDKPF